MLFWHLKQQKLHLHQLKIDFILDTSCNDKRNGWLSQRCLCLINKAAFLLALEHVYGKQHETRFYT